MKNYRVSVNGKSYDVTVEELGVASAAAGPSAVGAAPKAGPAASTALFPASPTVAPGGGAVKSPMPGTLLSFKVVKGQAVRRGDVLLILEAMKMENEIVAPFDGVVTALCAAEGASVNTGDVLVELS